MHRYFEFLSKDASNAMVNIDRNIACLRPLSVKCTNGKYL